MSMILKVLESYKSPSNFEDPIVLIKDEVVQLGEKTDSDGEYPDWIFCISSRTGKSGWVAAGVLKTQNDTAIVLKDYTSKEMTVTKDELLEALYELNGWYWCKRSSSDELGWVAKNMLTLVS